MSKELFQNGIILLKLRHEWHTTISICARRNLTRGRLFKMADKLMFRRNYNLRQSKECQCDVAAFQFYPSRLWIRLPVIWNISIYLWYQVYFVIIIVDFLVTVLSITYLINIFSGWTVPLNFIPQHGHNLINIVYRASEWFI